MKLLSFDKKKTVVCDVNRAAALGTILSQPDLIVIYPITPQTSISEEIASYFAEGGFSGELVEVEGENSAMGTLIGASASGGRTFTATSSWGLIFMYDAMMMAAGQRLPIVMVNVNRETPHYMSVSVSRQDIMSVRDAGWIHVEADNCQEILDSVLFAYRLSEDIEISLPTVISYDGFYLSHLSEKVDVPSKSDVREFFKPLVTQERIKMDCDSLMSFFTSCTTFGGLLTEYRYQHAEALERVKSVFPEIRKEFMNCFEREYEDMIIPYKIEDADFVLITMGSSSGAAKVAVDKKRNDGIKIGLVRIKVFQPFPSEALIKYIDGKCCIGIIERSVSFQQYGGHLLPLVKSMPFEKDTCVLDFIVGLGSLDITPSQIEAAIDIMSASAREGTKQHVFWLDLDDINRNANVNR